MREETGNPVAGAAGNPGADDASHKFDAGRSLPRAAMLPPPSGSKSEGAAPKSSSPEPELKATRQPPIIFVEQKEQEKAKPDKRTGRFLLLAACVAIAACTGAMAGSLGPVVVDRLIPKPKVAAPPMPLSPPPATGADVSMLRDSVASMKGTVKTLGDNITALRASVDTTNRATADKLAKMAEAVERAERASAEPAAKLAKATEALERRLAAPPPAPPAQAAAPQAASPEVTGSITPKPVVAAPETKPAAPPPPPVLEQFVLRRVIDGVAIIEGRMGIIEAERGDTIRGLGRIEDIRRQEGRWVVVTQRGLIVSER